MVTALRAIMRAILIMRIRSLWMMVVEKFMRTARRGQSSRRRDAERQDQNRLSNEIGEPHNFFRLNRDIGCIRRSPQALRNYLLSRAISMRSPTLVPVRKTVCAGSSSTLVAFSKTAEIRKGRKCSST
jgi:hypothetical protein